MRKVEQQAIAAKAAARELALKPAVQRTAVLKRAAILIRQHVDGILQANQLDLQLAQQKGLDLTRQGILALKSADDVEAMAFSLERMANHDDAVNRVCQSYHEPSGLRREQRLVPLGVVTMVYEARPSVVCDSAGICLRTANALLLCCSPYSVNTDTVIVDLIRRALVEKGLSADCIQLVTQEGFEATYWLSQAEKYVSLLILRGGYAASAAIRRQATVPVLVAGPGNCHIFIDASAPYQMTLDIVRNSKVPRPLACNAAETLLVHAAWAEEFLSDLLAQLEAEGMALRGCSRALKYAESMQPAVESDWEVEFFAPVLAVKIVDDLDAAIDHINTYRTPHTECIITADQQNAERFLLEVEANVACLNASTRLTDGIQFGYGGEMGISTQFLPCGGPIGPQHLLRRKFFLYGSGHLRQ